ncbi:MAG: hypothetical protein U0T81_14380 [Saprospiraceae bacterium]
MADVLHRLGLYFYNSSYVNKQDMIINVMEHFISRNPEYYNNWLHLWQLSPAALRSSRIDEAQGRPDLRDEWVKRCTPQCILLGGTTEGTLEF